MVPARKTTTLALLMGLVLALALLVFGRPASAADPITNPGAPSGDGVTPVLIQNNPTCRDLGNYREHKVEPVQNGSYPSANGYLTATILNIRDEGNGPIFDWSSTRRIDRVIVKGGDAADSYVYAPEDNADTKLHAPVNPNNGKYFGLSHVSFCYDVEPLVSKTAATTFTRTHNWTIDKSVSKETWDLFRGDSGTSKYAVSVDKTGSTDSDWAVSGKITVTNPLNDAALEISKIEDVVSQGATSTVANVNNCTSGNNPISFPYSLAANASLECSYSVALGSGTNGTNTATAKASGTGIANGVGTANVTFGDPTSEVNKTVTVKDDFGGTTTTLGTATASKAFDPYTHSFTCDADEGTHNNTATVYGDNNAVLGTDQATVTVNCHALNVTKTADTSFSRTFNWTIKKVADPTEKTIPTGDSFSASYSVSVDATHEDGNHKVGGTITISNLSPIAATINSVSDAVSGIPGADVTVNGCGDNVTFPHTLSAGGTLKCDYSAKLPDKTSRTNTATATLQNKSYDPAGNATNSGTTGFSGSAAVDFTNATMTEVDKSVTVSDPVAGGTLGTASAGANGDVPKTFPSYSQTIGPYSTCGDQRVDNTASFVTNDTGATGSSTATVTAHVQCKLTVVKKLDPATDAGKFNLLIDGVVKAADVGDGGTTGAQQVALGSYTVSETAGTGTDLSEYVSKINCGGADVAGTSTKVSFASGDSDKTCTITNTKKGKVTVKKTTNKVVDPTKSIEFLLTGPGLPAAGVTRNTFGDQDGVLDFGFALVPGQEYTVCENPVPAGFTSFWKLDGTIVTPYNPDAAKSPAEDFGVRCFKFSAQPAQTRAFEVDNSHPGGDPRTIGYWKNWNRCTGGNQATNAAKNGGAAAGFFLMEDLLPQLVGDLNITTCAQGVKVLSKQDQNGTNRANDAAYELAAQLLAAKLNLAAGAETCTGVQTAVKDGQALLDQINFTGTGSYLTKASTNRAKALSLAATLDKYNNGNVC